MTTPSLRGQIHDALTEAGVCFNRLILGKNGTVEIQLAYFNRISQGAESWAAQVAAALPGATVTTRDDYGQWPKKSYFTAVVRFPGPNR